MFRQVQERWMEWQKLFLRHHSVPGDFGGALRCRWRSGGAEPGAA